MSKPLEVIKDGDSFSRREIDSSSFIQDWSSIRGKMVTGIIVSFAFYACFAYAGLVVPRSSAVETRGIKTVTPSLPYPEQFQQSWSQYSPYFPRAIYQPPPIGCKVNQVSLHLQWIAPNTH